MDKRQIALCGPGILLLSWLFALVPVAGCGEPSSAAPQFRAETSRSSGAAEQNRVRGTFFNSHTFYVDCLGEDVRFFGDVEYTSHEVTTGSENYEVHFHYGPFTPNNTPFVAEGQSSGTIFSLRYGVNVKAMVRSGPGEGQAVVEKEVYIAADGRQLFLTYVLHLTVNANGELTVFNEEPLSITCAK